MLVLFIILSVLEAILLAIAITLMTNYKKLSDFWSDKWMDSIGDYVDLSEKYDALETGNDEIEENYQQEILSLYDQLEVIANSAEYWKNIAEELEKIRTEHDFSCLPVLGTDIYPTAEEDDTPLFDVQEG